MCPLASEPSDLVVTGTSLFLSFAASGTVVRQSIPPNGAGTTIAEMLPSPTVMATNGVVLFVACTGDSTIRKLALSP